MKLSILLAIILGLMIPCLAQEDNTLFVTTIGGKRGYLDQSGNIVINPLFDEAYNFSEGLARVQINGKWGFINRLGRIVITPQFSIASDFSNGLARIFENGQYGYVDKSGQIVISPQFNKAYDFSDGLARIKVNEKNWKFIDKSGNVIFHSNFDYVEDFYEGRAVVYDNDKVAYIDKTGKLTSNWVTYATKFSEGLAVTSTDSRIISSLSRYGIKFDKCRQVDNCTYRAHNEPFNYQVIDKTGKIIFEGVYDDIFNFSDGLAAVIINGKVGFINRNGEIVIKPQFDSAEPFSEGIAYVGIGKQRYFIDKLGKIIFETEFSLINGFRSGLAEVFSCKLLPCTKGYLNPKGVLISYDR